jgi:hypothetical protein
MVSKIRINSSDIEKIEANLKKNSLQLDEISYSINGYAIAKVSTINSDDTDDFWPSSYMVIIDVKKKTHCKFYFYGYKTDGIKILAKPRKGRHFIFNTNFDIKFISSIDEMSTPYILISYLDYDDNYNDENCEGLIYTCIYDLSNNSVDLRSSSRFKFEDCSHFDNSVEVCLVDQEGNTCLFAYKQLSKCKYDSEYDIKREYMYDFDGIWNTSLYCTDKKIIPLNGDNFLDAVNDIRSEIESEKSEEFEQERWERSEEFCWKAEQDMLEYDNRSYREMIDDYEAWGNID